jgi:hypothetical protein
MENLLCIAQLYGEIRFAMQFCELQQISLVLCSIRMQSVKENLLAALRHLLKPLARLAIKNGATFPEFSNALKEAYTDAGARQLSSSGKEPTDEGIALITNIPTADVHSIRRSDAGARFSQAAEENNPLPTLLSAWHTDQKYTGPYGVLRDLPFSRAEDPKADAATFTDLAETYCPGISAKAILDELVRTGSVVHTGEGYYRALKRSYVPPPLSAKSLLLFARVVHNLCEAAERNLRPESQDGKGLIERTIYTVHGISKKDLSDFDKFIRARGQIFADDIDNWLSDRDKEGIPENIKTGVGFYHYIVNDEDDLTLAKELPN